MAKYDVSILAAGREVSNARLQRMMAALLAAGLTIELFSSGNKNDLPAGVTFHSLPKGSRATRVFTALTLPWRSRGHLLLTPDPEGAIAIWLSTLIRKRIWAVDVREDYRLLIQDRQWAQGGQKFIALALAKLALFASSRADLTVVVDEWVAPLKAKNRLVVKNSPDIRFLPKIHSPEIAPRAIYIGDVRSSRGLWAMLGAIELAPEWKLDIVGAIANQDLPRVLAWKETSLASSRVKFHGVLKPIDAWQFAAGAWVGFCLLEKTPAFARAWPTKIGEYLAAGIPVITSDLPRPSEVILANGAGAVVSNESSDQTAVESGEILNLWSTNPERYQEVRAKAEGEVTQWRSEARYDLIPLAIAQLMKGKR